MAAYYYKSGQAVAAIQINVDKLKIVTKHSGLEFSIALRL